MEPNVSVPLEGQYWSHFIRVLSSSLVIMTMVDVLTSQHIFQKSANVSTNGPYSGQELH